MRVTLIFKWGLFESFLIKWGLFESITVIYYSIIYIYIYRFQCRYSIIFSIYPIIKHKSSQLNSHLSLLRLYCLSRLFSFLELFSFSSAIMASITYNIIDARTNKPVVSMRIILCYIQPKTESGLFQADINSEGLVRFWARLHDLEESFYRFFYIIRIILLETT